MSKRDDIPPAYHNVAQHGVFPVASHDERARFNFLANLNKHVAMALGPGNAKAYERRVLPAFRAEHGREPKDRFEIRHAMNADPYHRFWSALKRNNMEMRQQNGRSMVIRQLGELNARARQWNEGRDTLELDPGVAVPRYQAAVDIHCMPGSYHGEVVPGDVSAGANYDCGIFVTTGGGLGALSDGGGQALVKWIARERPGWVPKRILDIGTTIGHNAVPLAVAFPDSEVIAIDTAAPSLRYGHARAQSMGVRNIRFVQANAEELGRFPDGHFDWVQTTMFLHETSGKALPRIIDESYRLLSDGGLMFHLEQPAYTDDMPLFEQFMRDWDAFNNNEPFWSAMHALDLPAVFRRAGFADADLFEAKVRAVVDTSVFPSHREEEVEDFGRAAVWHAYGAWKNSASLRMAAE
ncbi:class I SAM-dependent methyltransferase [Sandaracinobacteroides saxicola]|uniref:Class I SAM-dependent methyltransferase n=1 Tax=Sandaracinobacteroides saxicola TaxID=2759707 RepID=A0A7G5IGK8_9SPHN|nr:class I SAM-dependent methyltransferase [Sandaracinobacteroides saxicola]QMW22500.1 class I SAM-dependent methyltransferase [Sandaracinobacteroides saxicola]